MYQVDFHKLIKDRLELHFLCLLTSIPVNPFLFCVLLLAINEKSVAEYNQEE